MKYIVKYHKFYRYNPLYASLYFGPTGRTKSYKFTVNALTVKEALKKFTRVKDVEDNNIVIDFIYDINNDKLYSLYELLK